ncbi:MULTISPECIES: hypothetical protein [Actinosynnema]|uniref:hypothetical protein n=1 Tax=Actinosynnema TaxID=40566 RepID=UPI0020A459B0|nr:hypothetical protein [Actinosynnema pretiosum]MCP2092685.1 hypothetical protein [Actinosynnema pretiosum]
MSKITTMPIGQTHALDDLVPQLDLLRSVDDLIDALKKVRADAQRMVKTRLSEANAEVGTVGGVPAVTYRASLRIRLSPRLVRELHPEIVAECEEISEIRTFLLVDAA